jgi:hypothetical protein
METLRKKHEQKKLGEKLDALSQQNAGESLAEEQVNNTKHILANMPESEFKKLAEKIISEGDKKKIATLLDNWPFKDQ